MYKRQHQWELLVEVEGVVEEVVVGVGDPCGGRATNYLGKQNKTNGPGDYNDNRDGGLMEISRKINRIQFTGSQMERNQIDSRDIVR